MLLVSDSIRRGPKERGAQCGFSLVRDWRISLLTQRGCPQIERRFVLFGSEDTRFSAIERGFGPVVLGSTLRLAVLPSRTILTSMFASFLYQGGNVPCGLLD